MTDPAPEILSPPNMPTNYTVGSLDHTGWHNKVGYLLNRGTVNLFDFGAKGDNSTNDRVAVQAFFDYLSAHGGHGIAYDPSKPEPIFNIAPYNIAINTPAHGFTFDGLGCTFRFSDTDGLASNGFQIFDANRVRLKNMTVDGGGAAVTTHAIAAYKSRDCVFENVLVKNYGGTGILCYEEVADYGGFQTYRNHLVRCVAFGQGYAANGFSHVQSIASTMTDCEVIGLATDPATANPGYGLQLKNACSGCSIRGGYVDTANAGVAFGFTNPVAQRNNTVSGVMVKNCTSGFNGAWMDGNSIDLTVQMLASYSTYGVFLQDSAVHNNIRARVIGPPAGSTIVRMKDDDNRVHLESITNLSTATLASFDSTAQDNLVVVGSVSDKTDAQLSGLPVTNAGGATNKILFERLLG